MPKTEVILIHNIVGLGGESDQVKVAAGYARNYLFPQRLAIPLTGANKRRIEALKQRRAQREADELNHMNELSKSLGKLTALVTVKTGEDGRMFGSVTAGTIADQLKNQFDVSLDKKKIHLEHPIRTLGDHEVELRLHADVVTTLKVRVESSTPLAAPAEAPAAPESKDREQRTEKRGRRPERAAASAEAAAPAAADHKEHSDKKHRAPKAEKAEKSEKPAKAKKSE
jgi:large subunit ribosomal protein L9